MSSSVRRTGGGIAAFAGGLLAATVVAACGGGGGDEPNGVPTLAGTPLPTVTAVPTPTPVCDPPQALALPADFPPEVPVPPGFVVWELSRTPYLHVVGRVVPPPDQRLTPNAVLLQAILDHANANRWHLFANSQVDGVDYTFTLPDGRQGHVNVNVAPCPGQAQLTWDLFWVKA